MSTRSTPVLEPEDLADYFHRNPDLAKRAPEVVAKVSDALKAKAESHEAAEPVIKSSSAPQPAARSGGSTLGSLISTRRQLDELTPGRVPGRSGVIPRLIVAFFAGLFALEAVSYITGQRFNYNLGQLPATAGNALKYVGLYGGQQAQLASLKTTTTAPAPASASTALPNGFTV